MYFMRIWLEIFPDILQIKIIIHLIYFKQSW